jgi:hypothetical protein
MVLSAEEEANMSASVGLHCNNIIIGVKKITIERKKI